MKRLSPVIEELPGWKCDISGCRNWEELPENAKSNILTLEKLISHKIHLVSTGAEREEYLLRD